MFHGCTIANLNITINKLKCVKLCDLKTLDVTGPHHEIKRDAYFDVIVEGMSEVLKWTFRNTKNLNKKHKIFNMDMFHLS